MNKVKLILIVITPIILVLATVWLSGFYFLSLAKLDNSMTNFLTTYEYWNYYGDQEHVLKNIYLGITGSILTFAIPIFFFIFSTKKRKLYGDAKWATDSEIKKVGLHSEKGIIVGQTMHFWGLKRKLLILPNLLHVMLAAPTRSGKGVGIVIPNALTYPDSMVILDIKKENWNITSGFRSAHGQDCFLLNLSPRDHKTHCWNCLSYISNDPSFRINDIQGIGQMLFPTNSHEAPIWQASSRSLWLGIVLYLIESESLPVTLGEVLRQVTKGDEELKKSIEERHKEKPLSLQCYSALNEYLNTSEKTRSSIKKGFTSSLELLYNPLIDLATSKNDFDLRDIRKKKMTIYVSISPNDLERLAPLINLFFQQLIDLNTRELPEDNPDLKYECLILPDEFTAIGKVNIISKSISYIAGYGLRLLPVIQSPSQLRSVYGADDSETFMDNHALKIIFPPKDFKAAKEISDFLGTLTVKNQSHSKSRPSDFFGKGSNSENTSEHGRALLMPQEIIALDPSSQIIMFENSKPILCKKIKWYEDPVLKLRGNGKDGIIKWPSPTIPKLNLKDLEESLLAPEVVEKTQPSPRTITEEELNNIQNLDLSDFNCDFSSISIPDGDISDSQMNDLVGQFFEELQTPTKTY